MRTHEIIRIIQIIHRISRHTTRISNIYMRVNTLEYFGKAEWMSYDTVFKTLLRCEKSRINTYFAIFTTFMYSIIVRYLFRRV